MLGSGVLSIHVHDMRRAFRGMFIVYTMSLVESTRLVFDGSMWSMVCRAVFLSCVGGSVACLGALWFYVGRSSSVSMCACGSAFGMRDGGHVAPPSYILQYAVLWECVCGDFPAF